MVVVSYSGKEINAKLVYYGAGLSGKTTNLEAIYEAVPETSRGKMVSMKTQSDRTLFFDLLPLDLGEIMGFKTRFLLYTVPGQVFYNATRKLVLKGADAIVFVADSEVGKMEENKESLQNLRDNLAEYKLSLDDIPWVIQYNKRDLPNVYTCEELNAELNPDGKLAFFEAVATQGKGVFETFRGISHLLMEKVTKDLRRSPAATTTAQQPPRPAPVEEPARPAPAAPSIASPPPLATARTIGREAQAATANGGPDVGSLDYGREIELPQEIPPAHTLVAPPVPAPVAEAAPAVTPAPAPAMAGAAPAWVEATSAAPKFPMAAPQPPTPSAAETRPRMTAAVQSQPSAPQASSEVTHTLKVVPPSTDESNTITVPVTLPAGQSAELVIRIVFKRAA